MLRCGGRGMHAIDIEERAISVDNGFVEGAG